KQLNHPSNHDPALWWTQVENWRDAAARCSPPRSAPASEVSSASPVSSYSNISVCSDGGLSDILLASNVCRDPPAKNITTKARAASSSFAKCSHGKRALYCRLCGGSQICPHSKIKGQCKLCKGKNICEHGKQKPFCVPCKGSQICEHERQKRSCKFCKQKRLAKGQL
ncbi:MAG: hypothetical protein SGCHY_004745, partial [Lobulomycetales sp.]